MQPRLKAWMDALSYSERLLLTRVAMTQAGRDLVKERMEAMVARGEPERSPYDPDVYGTPRHALEQAGARVKRRAPRSSRPASACGGSSSSWRRS